MQYFVRNKIIIAFLLVLLWLYLFLMKGNSFYLYVFWDTTQWTIISSYRIAWERDYHNNVLFYIWDKTYTRETMTQCKDPLWFFKTKCFYKNRENVNIIYSKANQSNFIVYNTKDKIITYISFLLWILSVIISIIWIYLFRKYSTYLSRMKKWKIPTKILTGKVINIIPKLNKYKQLSSWSFQVTAFDEDIKNSNIYKSDIFEYKGKTITNKESFIQYTNNFVKKWDKLNVYISTYNPKFYYIKNIFIPKV